MNARMTAGKQITLPDEVVEALQLEPGSEVAFERGPGGDVVLRNAAGGSLRKLTAAEIRAHLERVAANLPKPAEEFAGMTTDEIMEFLRGE
jgi:bifunctional DNA-binding transcriptional regulator/antitoxin component of YhaV-PrlF toxin-antitoxin module